MKQQKMLTVFLLLFFCLTLVGCALLRAGNGKEVTSESLSPQEKALWNSFVVPYVQNIDFNTSIELYDLCTYMLIPMNAAFLYQEEEEMSLFKNHVNAFLTPSIKNNYQSSTPTISKIQYLFFLSEYSKLAQIYANKTNDLQFISAELISFIESELTKYWNEPAWQWDSPPFSNMKARIDWKLSATPELNNFYKKWIIDSTFYVFGIAGNLKFITRYSSQEIDHTLLDDILTTAKRVFQEGIQYESEGGWVLQPGIPKDHPNYSYAGYSVPMPADLPEKKMVDDISWDTSHFMRIPVILECLRISSSEYEPFYTNLQQGLSVQFYNKILVPPDSQFSGYRVNNFIGGQNGVFRYQYNSVNIDGKDGYGPYELSFCLIPGWWVFIRSGSEGGLYENISKVFPLDSSELSVYLGPASRRPQSDLRSTSEGMAYNSELVIIPLLAKKVAQKLQTAYFYKE